MNVSIEKNILDLHFQKQLIIASTCIVIAFTYVIGVAISFLSQQVDISSGRVAIALILLSGAILCPCAFIFIRAVLSIRKVFEKLYLLSTEEF